MHGLWQIPSKEQVEGLSAELGERGRAVPAHVHKVLQALPPDTHPMTQFSVAVMALQVRVLSRVVWQCFTRMYPLNVTQDGSPSDNWHCCGTLANPAMLQELLGAFLRCSRWTQHS